ncbi:MAG: glycosyltransferase family 39 protein [Tannerellaceae bacterium]|nr:glycosyltransferase family 39 protein [Tannerellaceae bacterium]
MKQRIYEIISDRQQVLGFGILTGLFVLLNLITITWTPLPWLDEVWFIDTAVNFALNGSWTTTAQLSFGGETPIALYPPLYQYLLAGWIKLGGFSILSVRSFNIFIAAIVSIVLFKGLRKLNHLKSWYTILIFVFLFWGTGLFSWSYRNGRPDMVNILCSVLFLYSYFMYLKRGYGKWKMWLTVVFVLLSGLQACPFIVTVLIYVYFIRKEYRSRTKIAFFITILGFMTGICLLWGHFIYHNHPRSFFWQFSHSATISQVLHKIPFLSEFISPEPGVYNAVSEFLDCYLKNKNYAILTLVNIFVLSLLLFKNKTKKHSIEVFFLGFSFLMPAVMFLAGHCLSPYTWMFYLPSVIVCIICLEKQNHIFLKGIYGILTVLFTVISGLPKSLAESDRSAHTRITQFIEKQNFKKDVVLLSSYSVYYPIREITKNSYYPVYPARYLPPKIEYILKDETDQYRGEYDNFDQYIMEQGNKLIPVDSLAQPKIVLYKVAPN